jgi:hypothetical protein
MITTMSQINMVSIFLFSYFWLVAVDQKLDFAKYLHY